MRVIKKIVWLVAIIITALISLPLFIGWYLSPQDNLEKVGAIVVVSGGDSDARIRKGVQLYKEGWSELIIFSGAAAEGDVSNAQAMKNISVSSGVPAEDVLIEETSQTTVENAQNTAILMAKNDVKSIILVTSPYHQRRTYQLFKKYFPEGRIINQSALDEEWRKKGWWQTNVGRFLTVGELGKIIVNFIGEKGNSDR